MVVLKESIPSWHLRSQNVIYVDLHIYKYVYIYICVSLYLSIYLSIYLSQGEDKIAFAFRVSSRQLAMKAANWLRCMALGWFVFFWLFGISAARNPAAAELSPAWGGAHITRYLAPIYKTCF